MRLASFNVWSGRSMVDGRVDLSRLAAAVRRLDADVLGLQEVDRGQERSLGASLTDVAADAMGATSYRFVPALVGPPDGPWTAATGDEPQDTPAYGVALLSRVPVVSWQVFPLAALRVRVPYRWPGAWRPVLVKDEPRVAVAATLEGLTVATTHLSFLPGWNGRQLVSLRRQLASVPGPLVLMGDLNMSASSASRLSGMRPLVSGRTFPSDRPRKQLDHVLARGDIGGRVTGEVLELALSDHRAVIVELRDPMAVELRPDGKGPV
jgi:endonuclease/exonuclease/phosphatase family metal-dependent hydrolase